MREYALKAELIINQTAGGGKSQKYIPKILNYFDSLPDFEYQVSYTPASGEAAALSLQAAERGVDTIISVGGDGTINEIINGILQSTRQPALGIIPAGWANDFIKSVPIPKDIRYSCHIISQQKTKMIDVALINKHTCYVNIFGIGLDANIAALANMMKTKYPNWKTLSAYVYVFATIKTLLSPIPFFQAKITIDNQTIEGEMLLVAVANGQTEGGKFKIAPEAEIDDGLLDIYIIRKINRFRCLYFFPKAMNGTHLGIREVSFYRGKEIFIETARPVTAQVAGEILPAENHYHIQLLPGKLKLIVP